MIQKFIEKGYEIVNHTEKADIYIVNTCTVTNMSDRKSRQMLRKQKQINPYSIVVACGCYVQVAKDELEKQGINIRVVDIHTIKPIDEKMIIKCAQETQKLISVEDHNIIGGLGSAISEVLTDKYPQKLTRLGIKDCFGMSGKAEELVKYFGIDSETIVEICKM